VAVGLVVIYREKQSVLGQIPAGNFADLALIGTNSYWTVFLSLF